jgi:hypothetical protein
MKVTQNKSDILDPKPVEQGFIVGKYDDPLNDTVRVNQ